LSESAKKLTTVMVTLRLPLHNFLRAWPSLLTRSKTGRTEIKHEIEGAFRRNTDANANRIMVEANGGKVTKGA
jgi:hypothetical protein